MPLPSRMTGLKILCLHGFTSNGAVHAHQVRRITARLPEYEFVFPDGPHKVDIASQFDVEKPENKLWTDMVNSYSSSGHRAWWFAKESKDKTIGELAGLETSLEYISTLLQQQGPFHAIWGFSQGAGFAALLCALLQESQTEHPLRKYFPTTIQPPLAGIIFSGFKARFLQYNEIYSKGISLPTIHIIGVEDMDVTKERSMELVEVCSNPTVLEHQGGHNVARLDEDQIQVVEFIRRCVVLPMKQPRQSSI